MTRFLDILIKNNEDFSMEFQIEGLDLTGYSDLKMAGKVRPDDPTYLFQYSVATNELAFVNALDGIFSLSLPVSVTSLYTFKTCRYDIIAIGAGLPQLRIQEGNFNVSFGIAF